MHLIPNSNIVFVHIPKTAGQAVRKTFGMQSDAPAHSIAGAEDTKFLGKNFIRFCVVRNPMDRFISAYRYNALMSKNIQDTGLTSIIHQNDLHADINAFVDFLKEKYPDIKESSIHMQRQVFFIRRTQPQIILRQETLADDIQIIRRLAPEEAWKGLQKKNVAEERFDTSGLNLELSPENEAFVLRYYKRDFDALGYRPGRTKKRPAPGSEALSTSA